MVPECELIRKELARRANELELPTNFLDAIIDACGGAAGVAEMTGRRGRTVRGPNGRLRYELRAKQDTVRA